MKVLIVSNIRIKKKTGENKIVTGGWIKQTVKHLSGVEDMQIGVVMPTNKKELTYYLEDNVIFFNIPSSYSRTVKDSDVKEVLSIFKPDILHVEGSEFSHAKKFITLSNDAKVLSLQGIVNGIYPYYTGGLRFLDMLHKGGFAGIIGYVSVIAKKIMFKQRLKYERKTIAESDHIIGRTEWDKAYSLMFNPRAHYYSVDRLLRDAFYSQEYVWSSDKKEEYSIYFSSSYQPLKGFHHMLEAVGKLKNKYPKIKVYVGGISPYDERVKRSWIKNGYAKYLRKLINNYELEDHILFLGELNDKEVARQLSRTHVFCLTSAIDNSPNALAEAMILGVPSVASYVGGVPSMAEGKGVLMYPYDDVAMLSHQIDRIFSDDKLSVKMSIKSRRIALKRHDVNKNISRLMEVYREINKCK